MSRYSSRSTTAEYFRLDVRYLQRHGMLAVGRDSVLRWSRAGQECGSMRVLGRGDGVTLSYTHQRSGGDRQQQSYAVFIEWTPCHYGGHRAWFRCPAANCGRRAAVLYGGPIFACRQCHQLSYESQREQPWDRAISRAASIQIKLGGTGCLDEGIPPKRKGMHWRTYHRLAAQLEEADTRSWPTWLLSRLLETNTV